MRSYALASMGALLSIGVAAADRAEVQAIPVEAVVPFDPSPVRAEGRQHLLYELHVTNFGKSDLQLTRLDVNDPTSGAVVQSISGNALASAIYEPGVAQSKDKNVLPSGRRVLIFMDVVLPAGEARLRALRHRFTFAPVKTINLDEQSTLDAAPVRISRKPIPIVGPPLRGGCWVASHALSNESSHRRTVIALNGRAYDAQRFAIDWIRVGRDGQAFRGNPANNRNWSAYGADVLAVADGRVIEATDGIPENDPTSDHKAIPINLVTVVGNQVLLDIGNGVSVLYAHLKPGSIGVRAGQRVRKGELIGKVGNSGQADAPHLHIHLVVGKSALAGEGEPYEFQSFKLQGHLSSLSVLANGQGWRPTSSPQLRTRELPVENAVVQFPGGASPCARVKVKGAASKKTAAPPATQVRG